MFGQKLAEAGTRRRLLLLGGAGAAFVAKALHAPARVVQALGPLVGTNNYAGALDANADGVQGYAVGAHAGIFGRNNDLNGTAVFGAAPNGTGVFGESLAGTAIGGRSNTGRGLHGQSTNGYGVQGVSQSNAGVWGQSNGSVAVVAQSPSSIGLYATSGAAQAGVYAYSAAGTGPGVYGLSGNNAGVWGQSTAGNIGVYGAATTGTGICGSTQSGLAGLFYGPVQVHGDFTVIGGNKNAGVRHPDGSIRRMYSIEGPESWFEDVGTANLAAGRATVKIDTEFALFIRTDDYQVFLTPEGDCKGLYVTAKTASGFDVRELQGGTSSLSFSFRIVARRKDITGPRLERVPDYAAPTRNALPQPPDAPTLPDLVVPNPIPTLVTPTATPTAPPATPVPTVQVAATNTATAAAPSPTRTLTPGAASTPTPSPTLTPTRLASPAPPTP